MKAYHIAGAFALGFFLTACNPPSPVVPPTGAKLTIGQVAQGDFTKACATFNVAVGYYRDVALFIPTTAQATADAVIAAGTAVCSVNPANVNSALTKLNGLWVKIQALTTVPK